MLSIQEALHKLNEKPVNESVKREKLTEAPEPDYEYTKYFQIRMTKFGDVDMNKWKSMTGEELIENTCDFSSLYLFHHENLHFSNVIIKQDDPDEFFINGIVECNDIDPIREFERQKYSRVKDPETDVNEITIYNIGDVDDDFLIPETV